MRTSRGLNCHKLSDVPKTQLELHVGSCEKKARSFDLNDTADAILAQDRKHNSSGRHSYPDEYPILTDDQIAYRRMHEYSWDPRIVDIGSLRKRIGDRNQD